MWTFESALLQSHQLAMTLQLDLNVTILIQLTEMSYHQLTRLIYNGEHNLSFYVDINIYLT